MKTVEIRNQFNGLIWQIYHVSNYEQAAALAANACANGFFHTCVVPYDPTMEETFLDWRESPGGKQILALGESDELMDYVSKSNKDYENNLFHRLNRTDYGDLSG